MFINIRYLIITVICVFLALSIGIFMGAQLDSQSILLNEQRDLIANIQKQFEEINKTNAYMEQEIANLKKENELNEAYIKNIFPDYIKGKLMGVNVAIIKTTEDYSFYEAEKTLNLASANITAVITITDKVLEVTDEEKSSIVENLNLEKGSDLRTVLAQTVAQTLAGGETQAIDYLQEAGFLEVRGDFAAVPHYVLMAGGSKEKTNKVEIVDIPIIKQIKVFGFQPVGIELSNAANSYMTFYKKQRISTVDNVDTVFGQTSLIHILAGSRGNFGVKDTADALMPSVSEEE